MHKQKSPPDTSTHPHTPKGTFIRTRVPTRDWIHASRAACTPIVPAQTPQPHQPFPVWGRIRGRPGAEGPTPGLERRQPAPGATAAQPSHWPPWDLRSTPQGGVQRGDQAPLWLRTRPQLPLPCPQEPRPSGRPPTQTGLLRPDGRERGAWMLGRGGSRGWGCRERARHSRRPAVPSPLAPIPALRGPELRRTRGHLRPPYLRPGRNRACGVPRSLRLAWRTRQKLPSPVSPGALPARRGQRPRTMRNGLRLWGQRHELPQGKLRPGAGSQLPYGLQSLTWQRVPEASATDRVPPTPTRTHRSWQQERPRVRYGAGLREALRPPTRASGGRGRASAGLQSPFGHPR